MMAQFIEIKAAHTDYLLFYRMGDFYELFFSDAEIAARALGIALTKRGKHLGQDIPMCGVPVHAADDYLQKLIALGHNVAVCEQTENPAEAKKRGSKAVVRREVIRLVTPGTITEEKLLWPGEASALATLARVKGGQDGNEYALAVVDISTGAFRLLPTNPARLSADLARLAPRELVIPDTLYADDAVRLALEVVECAVQTQPAALFDSSQAQRTLQRFYNVSTLDGFGQFSRAELAAAHGAIAYIEKTQIGERPALSRPTREESGALLYIDAATRANLELTRTLSGEREGSLLKTIDRTVSGAGARLLAERLTGPLTDVAAIAERHEEVAFWLHAHSPRAKLRDVLKGVPDLARALSRLSLNRGGPRDLLAVLATLTVSKTTTNILNEADDMPALTAADLQTLQDAPASLAQSLGEALAEDLPLLARDGGFIRDGFDEKLDELRALSRKSRQVIAGLQTQYAEVTGVKTLKVKHNGVLGYFIEVTALNAAALQEKPELFIHRQTMANAMRFTTTELADLESRIANAAGQALSLELDHFNRLMGAVMAEQDALHATAQALARCDVATALAELAEEQGYVRPIMDDSLTFHVVAGRHPVVEQALRKQAANPFVTNDCHLEPSDDAGALWLLTGPNMGGKSTFLRQNALIALMAQMGSFVPAGEARLGVVDRLFSRVGAADDLARGRSTFMVEMVETAAILNQATSRSLVILDEIGRGTATFDGLSIAWAAMEHLHAVNRCRTLFATHYHELTALSGKLDRLSNVTMKVKEWNGEVIFLHEVGQGSADRSYGIQVARLAGLPDAVIVRARTVLDQLESQSRDNPTQTLIDDLPLFSAAPPVPNNAHEKPDANRDKVQKALKALHPDEMTPRDALEALYSLKRLL
ncbi:MAG: DNA mismatch repair protein MutS [Pseudomonadota bacterium]